MKQFNNDKIIIFTDGSSLGNPGPGGYGAIIIFPRKNNDSTEARSTPAPLRGARMGKHEARKQVVELGGREENTTNNRMELTAVIESLNYLHKTYQIPDTKYRIQIYTDSGYLVNGITKWIHGWHQNNWKTKAKEDVLNKDLWQELFSLVYGGSSRKLSSRQLFLRGLAGLSSTASGFSLSGRRIDWSFVRGHVGIVGNERADLIATSFAEQKPFELFKGSLKDYEEMLGESLLEIPERGHVHPKRAHRKVYSYVSLVDGEIETHKTWADCEARVKGQSGAKYKKAVDKADEEEIIEEFSSRL